MCQQRCARSAECQHFSWWLDKGCHLSNRDATEVDDAQATSGPKHCVAPPTPAPVPGQPAPPATPPVQGQPAPPTPPQSDAGQAATNPGTTPAPVGGIGGAPLESLPSDAGAAFAQGQAAAIGSVLGAWSVMTWSPQPLSVGFFAVATGVAAATVAVALFVAHRRRLHSQEALALLQESEPEDAVFSRN